MSQPPRLLIVDDDPADHALVESALIGTGWQIDHVDDGAAATESAQYRRYALILIGVRSPERDGHPTAKAIRGGGGASAATPILAFCAPQQIPSISALWSSGMDDHVAKPVAPEKLRDAVDSWRPGGAPARTATLATIFGAAEIARLLDGFRVLLEAQLAITDGIARYAGAHRVAGIAGTLGFPDVSRLWLAVSEGDDTAYAEARIAARKALVQIDADPMPARSSHAPGAGR